jgi:ABC-2 type transport system ATP-binding protein
LPNESLSVEDLSFRYSSGQRVIDHMTWTAAPGTIVGLQGPNGSGKSTLLDLLCGVLRPTGGTLRLGQTAVEARASDIARIDADFDMFEYLTIEQNIDFFLTFYRRTCTAAEKSTLLARYGLADDRGRIATYASRGMRRKTQIVCALLMAPSLLVADEPLDGLDEAAQACWFEDTAAMCSRGSIVVYALHDAVRLSEHATQLVTMGSLSYLTTTQSV